MRCGEWAGACGNVCVGAQGKVYVGSMLHEDVRTLEAARVSRCVPCPSPMSACSSSVRTSSARSFRCLFLGGSVKWHQQPGMMGPFTWLRSDNRRSSHQFDHHLFHSPNAPRSRQVVMVSAAAFALVVVARPADLLDCRCGQLAGAHPGAQRADSSQHGHGLVHGPGNTSSGPTRPSPTPRRLGVDHPACAAV